MKNVKTLEFSIGLCDKDLKIQKIDSEEARKIVDNLIAYHFGFGSSYIGRGVYTHENGELVKENTIFVKVITDKKYFDFVEDVKKALNQESIGFEESIKKSGLL